MNLTWAALAAAALAGLFGLAQSARGAERNAHARQAFELPGGGWVNLPGRFVRDNNATRLAPIDDMLLVYGKRHWNIGGNQKISEALAVAHVMQFDSRRAFRRQAAHYLGDAQWRGPAREELNWQVARQPGLELEMRVAVLPTDSERMVLLAERDGVPLRAVAFVKSRYRDRAVEALALALDSYSQSQPESSSHE